MIKVTHKPDEDRYHITQGDKLIGYAHDRGDHFTAALRKNVLRYDSEKTCFTIDEIVAWAGVRLR